MTEGSAMLDRFRLRFWSVSIPAVCALLASCAPAPKPPPVLALTMVGGADQNPAPDGTAAPIAIRVYQLTSTAKFERADVFALTDRETETLGTESAGSQEFVLTPNEKRKLDPMELKPMVQAIGIVGLFRDIDNAKWRAMAPVAASGPSNLVLAVGKQAVILKPGP